MIEINCHSSIKISEGKTIYIDPFKIEKEMHDADIIFITHDHYDHYSPEDVEKVASNSTIIVAPKTVKALSKMRNVILVEPNNKYEVEGIKFETIPAYNVNKAFHPQENEWVGYVIEMKGTRYYIAGDTDITTENKQVKCDIALIPVGATYTMNFKEAAELANTIQPKIAIPTHYGSIVGEKEDGEKFKEFLSPDIECKILIKWGIIWKKY